MPSFVQKTRSDRYLDCFVRRHVGAPVAAARLTSSPCAQRFPSTRDRWQREYARHHHDESAGPLMCTARPVHEGTRAGFWKAYTQAANTFQNHAAMLHEGGTACVDGAVELTLFATFRALHGFLVHLVARLLLRVFWVVCCISAVVSARFGGRLSRRLYPNGSECGALVCFGIWR